MLLFGFLWKSTKCNRVIHLSRYQEKHVSAEAVRDNRAFVNWVKTGGQIEGWEIVVEGQVVVSPHGS